MRVPASPSATNAPVTTQREAELVVLVRDLAQLDAALSCGVNTLYCEFEDPKRYREAVRVAQEHLAVRIAAVRGESARRSAARSG